MSAIVSVLFVLLLALGLIVLVLKKMIYICSPNEVLIFSGKHRWVQVQEVVDGKVVARKKKLGYRLIKGGRGYRIPMLERVDRIDLTNMSIEVQIRDAYSRGAIPLTIKAVANVKIAGEEPIINNAIERFLGKSREEVITIIRETLEGNLRGVLATLTPEEVNEKKEKFVEQLQEEAIKDLQKLGVIVDTVNIQSVLDDKGYLDSIGRIKAAQVRKEARIAEATAQAQAAERAAQNKQQKVLKEIEVQKDIVEAEAKRRIRDAETRLDAVVAEERAKVTAALAKAQAEIEVQKARLEQVKRQLEADVLQPARAQADADIQNAKAEVANIIQDGRARAEAFRALAASWQKAGVAGRDMYLIQKLEKTLPAVLDVLHDMEVDKLTVLPAQGGEVAKGLASLREQFRSATGVDLADAASRLASKPRAS